MGNREPRRPSLASLFVGFVSIGMMSFGGGLAAWIRREVVQRRGWMDDQQFLSGYALSQLVPGATNVNLSVFIGAQLRGVPGAVAAVLGLTASAGGDRAGAGRALPAQPGHARRRTGSAPR